MPESKSDLPAGDAGQAQPPIELRPTMKLRWHMFRNPVTAKDVISFATHCGMPSSEVRQKLEQATTPVLQQWWEAGEQGEWRDIPFVCEAHPDWIA